MFAFVGDLKHTAQGFLASRTNRSRVLTALVGILLFTLLFSSLAPWRTGFAARGQQLLNQTSRLSFGASRWSGKATQQDLQQQTCSVGCNATVPTTGQINTAVSFQASATATNCASAPTYEWNFGDGSALSTLQNPTYAYTAAGTYNWTLTTRATTGTTTINTIAGGLGDGNPAKSVPFSVPVTVVRDPQGRGIYVLDLINGLGYIRFINTSNASVTLGTQTVPAGAAAFIAGGGLEIDDNLPALQTDLGSTAGIAVSNDGNIVYVSLSLGIIFQIRAINVSTSPITLGTLTIQPGNISTLPIVDAPFNTGLTVLTVGPSGDIFVADATPGINRVFRVTPTGTISVFAGNAQTTKNTDGFSAGAATEIPLLNPRALEFDTSGNLYIADTGHGRVIRVDTNGQASLVAQYSVVASAGNPPPYPSGLAFTNGKLYITLGNTQNIVRVDGVGVTPTISGTAGTSCGYETTNCGDGGPLANATYSLTGSTSPQPITGIEGDANGLYVLDQGPNQRGRVRYLNLTGSAVTLAGTTLNGNTVDTIAGNGLVTPYDGGLASSAYISSPTGVALDPNGNLYFSDTTPGNIRFVNRGTTTVTLFAGTEAQQTAAPGAVIRINKDVGTGATSNDVPVNRGAFTNPQGLFVNSTGIFIADSGGGPNVPPQTVNSNRTGVIRYINTTAADVTFFPNSSSPIVVPPGYVTTIAGGGLSSTSTGDNGFALSAKFIGPSDVVVATDGTIYVADPGNRAVRKINPQTGIVTSLTLANTKRYVGLGLDQTGRLYVTNFDDSQLLRENSVGSGTFTRLDTGGLNRPRDVAVDANNNAYVVNSEQTFSAPGTNAHRIMRVAADGTVTTFAGTSRGFGGDGGLATGALMNMAPTNLTINSINLTTTPLVVGIVATASGQVIFADANNGRLRALSSAVSTCSKTGQITIMGENPAPTLTNLTPNSALQASGAFNLTLTGTGFVPASVVRWNGADRTTIYVSATQLTAAIPATDLTNAGTAQVTVFNPTPGGGTSSAQTFTITAPNPTPTLSTLNPSSAVEGSEGFTLTVTGTNFVNGAVVRWDGTAKQTTFVSATQLTAAIPASDLVGTGTAQVTVFNPAPGGGVSNALTFTITSMNPVPTLTNLSPTSATAGGAAFTLTVNGTNFVGTSRIRWNGNDRPTTFVSATQLTAAIPATDIPTAGTAQVTVFNPTPGGGVTAAQSFTINNPAPTVTSLNPTSVNSGSAAFTLTVNGTNFVNGSVVRWNGADRTTTFVSATQLTAQITAPDVANAGAVQVTVFNPTPGGGTSSASSFTVVQTNPVPTITSLNPTSVTAGGAAFTLTVNGTNFVSGSVVRVNGADRSTTFVSATQLTAQVLASDINNAGAAAITVFNPAPGGGTASAASLTINAPNPLPTLTGLNPNNVTVNSGAFTLTVTGTSFVNGAVVRWNGADRTTSFVSATQLTAQIPASDVTTAGTAQVTVFNPAPGGGTSGTQTFTINANNPVPVATAVAPTSAEAGGAAFTLTVNGSNFVGGSVVRWNGSNRTTTFVNSTQLTAQITAADIATAGTAQVSVFNPTPGGGTSGNVSFTIIQPNPVPTITSLNPSTVGAGSAAFTLTITGTGFVSNSSVWWNGQARTSTFVNATTLTVQVPATDVATIGTAEIKVVNPTPGGGTSNTAALPIVANNPVPVLNSLNPTTANVGGATFTLTVTGSNFVNGAVVRWNGANRPTNFTSATQLTAQIPATDIAAVGTAQITVFNPTPGGGTSGAQTFTVVQPNPTPTIATLTPGSVTAGSAAFTLTITGTGFVNTSSVWWNGQARTSTFVNATTLTIQVPAADVATAGTAEVKVVNPAPGGGTSNAVLFAITQGNPVPTLTALAPAQALVGSGAFTLTVTGTNFVNGAVIRWNGSSRTTTFVNPTQLTATIPASDVAAVGTFPITVLNPTPGGGASNALTFTVNALNPVPALTSLAPNQVVAGGPAFTLTVNGTGFYSGSKVRWNGVEQPTTFVSATQLTAQLPASLIVGPGTGRISVINASPGGGVSNELALTIARPLANVSAASYLNVAFAPDSIIAAFGANLATGTELATTVPLPRTLRGTTVTVRDSAGVERQAQLFFVAASQVNYLLPTGTASGTATIIITSGAGDISIGTLTVAAVAPALFSANANGAGVAAAVALRVRANGTQVFEPVSRLDTTTNRFVPLPLDLGPQGDQIILVAFGSGLRGRTNLSNVTATLGGVAIPVSFAGAQGDLAGLDQLNLGPVPRSLAGRGVVELRVTVDGKDANVVTFSIQ